MTGRPFLMCALFALPAADAPAAEPVTRTVAARLVADLVAHPPNDRAVKDELARLKPDGSWPDVPYDNRMRAPWPPGAHLRRVDDMCRAYRAPASALHGDAALKAGILSAVHFWVTRDPQSDNWWFNDIDTPSQLAPVLLLMGPELPRADFDAAVRLVHRSTFKMTGANMTWEAGNLFDLAAATDDVALLKEAAGHLTSEIVVTEAEGVQEDWSFHQHGAQLNAGNYGLAFLDSCLKYGHLVAGTELALSPTQLGVLRGSLLDFQQWVVWGNGMDLSSTGRQLDNPHAQLSKAAAVGRFAKALPALDPTRADECQALAARIAGQTPLPDAQPIGNRCFWRSDFMVHRPGTFYASIKMSSSRVLPTETDVNAENLKGYHLSDGVTLVMVKGNEYADIQPAWDWHRLPGLTFTGGDATLPIGNAARKTRNMQPFVGGVSDGQDGLAAMDFQREDVSARKAWLCGKDVIVCLGAGLKATGGQPLITSINQCLLHGEAQVLKQGQWAPAADAELSGTAAQAVWHDQIGYLLPAGGDLRLHSGPQTGTWSSIQKNGTSKEPVTQNVFSLWLEHGRANDEEKGYVYALLPAHSAEQTAQAAAAPPFTVLANTTAVQAVSLPGEQLCGVVFHAPGAVDIGPGQRLAARQACLVLVRFTERGATLTVSDPTQTLAAVDVSLSGLAEAHVALPTGRRKGASVSVEVVKGT